MESAHPSRLNASMSRILAAAAALAVLMPIFGIRDAVSQPRERRASRSSKPLPGARAVVATTLANGMNVIVWPDHDIPNVALYIWYRVGSRNERPGITGISHFFEHMMFNGSKNYPLGSFDRVMEANGGANNAYTSTDVTVYMEWFPRSALETIFQLEADRICCLAIDSAKVESERGVISSERRTTVDDDSRSVLDEEVIATAFLAHPYQIPVIGWPSDIERWTLDDIRSHFRTYYAPNNATVVAVGDVSPEEIVGLCKRYFEAIPRQEPPPGVRAVEPVQRGERRVVVRKQSPNPFLQIAYHTGQAGGADAETRDLLERILTDGESSRLYRRLVDRDRVALEVTSYQLEGFDPGLLNFLVTPSPGAGAAAAESSLVDELRLVMKDGITEAELTKAKKMALVSLYQTLETIDGKAHALGENALFRGDPRALFRAPERFQRVTRDAIRALARKLFDERNRTVGILLPEEEAAPEDAGPSGERGKS